MADEITSAEAGNSDNSSQAAGNGASEDVAGLDTQESQQAAVESDDTPDESGESQSEAASAEAEVKKQKVSFEERLKEIDEANARKIQEMERRLEERLKEKTPDFDPPEVEASVERMILQKTARMRAIEEEINLNDGIPDANLQREYWDEKRWVQNAERLLMENRQKREAWEKKNSASQREQQEVEFMNKKLNEAAALVAQELGAKPEEWKVGEEWFVAKRQSNPALNAEYVERVWKDGPYRALKWAATYVRENMAKQAETNQKAKDEGKEKIVTGNSTQSVNFDNVKSWGDLMKMSSKEINRFSKEHPKKFNDLYNRHMK